MTRYGDETCGMIFRRYLFKLGSFCAPCVRNGLGTPSLRMRLPFDIAKCCIMRSGAMTQLPATRLLPRTVCAGRLRTCSMSALLLSFKTNGCFIITSSSSLSFFSFSSCSRTYRHGPRPPVVLVAEYYLRTCQELSSAM